MLSKVPVGTVSQYCENSKKLADLWGDKWYMILPSELWVDESYQGIWHSFSLLRGYQVPDPLHKVQEMKSVKPVSNYSL